MVKSILLRIISAIVVTALLLFLPAGTILWWQGWVYMVLFFAPMALIARYLMKKDQELLKKRLDTKETRPKQGLLANLFYTTIGAIFLIAGLDHRYGWSDVPGLVTLFSSILFIAGYYFLYLVFRTNRFLAHTVRVEAGQEVISTGPYSIVRHPMYLAELIMFVFTPLALGSYWALLPDIVLLLALAARIVTEERILFAELAGYAEYTQRTRYRLIPGVW